MEYFIEIVKYIGPIIGVFIGWLLARKNETDKIRYNEKKQVKRSLYVLLEIRNQLAVSKRLDRYMTVLIEEINKKLKRYTDEKVNPQQYSQLLQAILPSLIGENFQKDLKDQFSKCIDSLSEIDPVLAYRLNGKQNIQDYISKWEDESTKLFNLESIEDIQSVMDHYKPKLIDEIKGDLESIIQDVAALIGSHEVNSVNNLLQEPEEQEIQEDVQEYLDKLL
jgi:hypothetical protein